MGRWLPELAEPIWLYGSGSNTLCYGLALERDSKMVQIRKGCIGTKNLESHTGGFMNRVFLQPRYVLNGLSRQIVSLYKGKITK